MSASELNVVHTKSNVLTKYALRRFGDSRRDAHNLFVTHSNIARRMRSSTKSTCVAMFTSSSSTTVDDSKLECATVVSATTKFAYSRTIKLGASGFGSNDSLICSSYLTCSSHACLNFGQSVMFKLSKYASNAGTRRRLMTLLFTAFTRIAIKSPIASFEAVATP